MAISRDSLEVETTTPLPSSPTSPKPNSRRPISLLTLPRESMEAISRTSTTAAPTTAAAASTYPPTPSGPHPFSAFYSHPQCITSSELTRPSHEVDVEKGLYPTTHTHGVDLTPAPSTSLPSLHQQPSLSTTQTAISLTQLPAVFKSTTHKSINQKDTSYISVWPTCSEVQQRKKDLRRAKGCLLFRNLSRTHKIIVKVCLAFLVLSIVTVLAVVISYKTGGLVWKSANNYGAIGR